MQQSGKWNTTSQILKPKNIKLRDINGLTSSQTVKMWDQCRSQEPRAVQHSAASLKVFLATCQGSSVKVRKSCPAKLLVCIGPVLHERLIQITEAPPSPAFHTQPSAKKWNSAPRLPCRPPLV